MLMIAFAIVIYAPLLYFTFKFAKKIDSPPKENKQPGNSKSSQKSGDIN